MKALIFTYILTYGGAFVALFNPFIGLLIYIGFAILKPDVLWYWAVPQGNYSRIVALALISGWIVHGCGSWEFRRARGIVLTLLGYWGWSVLSALNAQDQGLAFSFVEELTKIVLPFLVGITTIDSVRRLYQVIWVIVLSYGYLAFECNRTYYEGFNIVQAGEIAGFGGGSMAISMLAGLPVAFFLGFSAKAWWSRSLAFLCVALMGHVVLFSFSRGGVLGLFAIGLTAFFFIPKKPLHLAIFLAAILLMFKLAGPEVRQRFSTTFASNEERDESAQSRLDLWADCLDSIARRPWLGVGPFNWRLIAHEYGWSPGKEAHTTWLQVAAEAGIPAVAYLILFYALTSTRLWSVARGRHSGFEPAQRYAAAMVISSIAGFVVTAQFVTIEGLETPYYVAMLGAALLKLSPSDVNTATQSWASTTDDNLAPVNLSASESESSQGAVCS